MKKYIPFLFILLFVYSCKENKPKLYIGVSQCIDDLWRRQLIEEMKTEAQLNSDYQIELKILNANNNVKKQEKDVETLINSEINVLIISANQELAVNNSIKKAKEKNIPVIILDRKISSSEGAYFIGADNYKMGKLCAMEVSGYLNGKKQKNNILEIHGTKNTTPEIDRTLGFSETLDKNKILYQKTDIYADWKEEVAYQKTDSLFLIDKNINIVFTHSDLMGKGVYKAMQKHHLKIPIFSIDALRLPGSGMDMVKNGEFYSSVYNPTNGDKAIQYAVDLFKKKPVPRYSIFDVYVVDASNVENLYLQSKIISEQNKKIKNQIIRLNDIYQLIEQKNILLILSFIGILLVFSIALFVYYTLVEKQKTIKLIEKKQYIITSQNEKISKQHTQALAMIKKLEELSEIKSNIFRGISHEFNTNLTLMRLYLSDEKMNEKLKKNHLQVIYEKLKNLSHEAIDFQNIENTHYKANLSYGNIGGFIKKICDIFALKATEKKLSLTYNYQKINCEFDKVIVEKILDNLISNAIKYTEQGKIEVNVKEENQLIKIIVEDTGIGIEKNRQNKLFVSTESKPTQNQDISYGIGLSFCKELALTHNGILEVQSQEGKGSVFTFTFPKKQTQDNNIQTNTKKDIPTILIVEDNVQLRNYLVQTLNLNYNVLTSENGQEGYNKALNESPDIIISDILMPEMDGITFCQKIKNNVQTLSIPFVMLTAVGEANTMAKAFDFGADAYLTKPFNAMILHAQIKNLLNKKNKIKALIDSDNLDTQAADFENEEKTFLNKLTQYILDNIDEELSVEQLAKYIGYSRSNLYRKIKEIKKETPVEFIRNIRLDYALKMLHYTKHSVSEISYKSGFMDSKYFTKCFVKRFKIYPSEIIKNKSK